MKIVAIAGSNSDVSINKQLAAYAASLFTGFDEVEVLDMNPFEMPIYKHEREVKSGIPQEAVDFAEKVDSADLLIVALGEHNGTYSTAFKNVFDWVSRIKDRTVWGKIPMLLMSTSPGGRGGLGVLEAAANRFPFHGGNVVDTFSLPFFYDSFNSNEGKITNEEKNQELVEKVAKIAQLEAILAK